MLTKLYSKIRNKIDQIRDTLEDVAKYIHSNPELGLNEYKACNLLCKILEENGFNVQKGIGELETAFVASIAHSKTKPSVAFICEYDALPEIGHGCGHNLIAAASLGAALGLKEVFNELNQGEIKVIGTPAEETVNGKLFLIKEGVFNDLDAAMLFHPSNANFLYKKSLALISVDIEFIGKPSHASASPEKGINALDSMILFFNSIGLLRQQLPDNVRIHGIITHGGKAKNIIPDYTKAEFLVRAIDKETVLEVVQKLENCAQGAAISTGAKVKITVDKDKMIYDMKPDTYLTECFEKHLISMGIEPIVNDSNFNLGSTDMGNVSYVAPSIHPYLSITEEYIPTHSYEFSQAAISPKGLDAMIIAAKCLALTGLDVLNRTN